MSMYEESVFQFSGGKGSVGGQIEVTVIDADTVCLTVGERGMVYLGKEHIAGTIHLKRQVEDFDLNGPVWNSVNIKRPVKGKPFERKPLTENQTTILVRLILVEFNAWLDENREVLKAGQRKNIERRMVSVNEDIADLRRQLAEKEAKKAALEAELALLGKE